MSAPTGNPRDARAYAVFASTLPTDSSPSHRQLVRAERRSLLTHHGVDGCLSALAYAYGADQDTAAHRMRWARRIVGAEPGRRAGTPSRLRS